MSLEQDATGLRLCIEDDGRGFDSDAMAQHPRHGIGRATCASGLMAVGGSLQVTSRPQRTMVVAEVPRRRTAPFCPSDLNP